MQSLIRKIGRKLAQFLSKPSKREVRVATCLPEELTAVIRKGDVLLVEGSSRFSTAIKYLTQSTWSHAAICIADPQVTSESEVESKILLEADVLEGVRCVGLSKYWNLHTRICRPIGLTQDEIDTAVKYAQSRIGHQYDLKNITDLVRYLIQTPPVPARWRRRLLALGSGDPTKAICSSLIAQAFQTIRYPILPEIELTQSTDPACKDCYDEYLHIRHHSLFAPRDFDISPYFQIIKPTLEKEFDPHKLTWVSDEDISLQVGTA